MNVFRLITNMKYLICIFLLIFAGVLSAKADMLTLELFYRTGCSECHRVKQDILPVLEQKYSGRYIIKYCELGKTENYISLVRYQEAFECKKNTPVYMVVNGRSILAGYDEIKIGLFQLLSNDIAVQSPATEFPADQELFSRRLARFSWPAIAIAGFIDGINPCVFATLIFFISLLFSAKFKKTQILLAGAVYCFGCFLTYLLLGFGLFCVLQSIACFSVIKTVLEVVTMAALLVLSVLSVIDAFQFKKRQNAKAISVQLPDKLKVRIHDIMRRSMKYRYLLPSIFMLSVVVTLIESVCTGQVYLPTLILLTQQKGIGIWFFYLLLYNLMFILPLIIIFVVVWRGSNVMDLIRWSKRQVFISKIAMGLFFFLLAVVMLLLIR